MMYTNIVDAISTNHPLLPHKVNVPMAEILLALDIMTKQEKLEFNINYMNKAVGPMISMSRKF